MIAGPRESARDRIVIIGAGFGGFQAAQSLAGAAADVLLIDRNNYHTFIPLIYQVATAQLEPSLVAYPIRTKLRRMKNVRFMQAQAERIDFVNKLIDTGSNLISYDYLVIATGTQSSYQQAAATPDRELQRQLLTFTIVGGGATGVEVAGALAEWWRGAAQRDFPELVGLGRIVLVQSGANLLSEFSQRLGNYTHRQLTRLGVEVHLNTKIATVTANQVQLSNQVEIATATVIWAAGTQAALPALVQPLESAPQGQLMVSNTLQVFDHPNVYAIGDVVYHANQDSALASVAPAALQQGVAVARNLQRQMRGQPLQPFRYWDKGRLAIVGGYGGVGRIAGVNFGGFLAWLMWLLVHVAYLPGYRSRLLVLLTWVQNYGLGDRALRQLLPTAKPR